MQLRTPGGLEGRVLRGHGRLQLRPLVGLEGEAGVEGEVKRGHRRL